MTKISSSQQQIQTEPITAIVIQSLPLIVGDENDQKAENGGFKHSIDEKGIEDDGVDWKNMCIIGVRNEEDQDNVLTNDENEKVCRICQLIPDHLPAGAGNDNLVLLGCACKRELGISHYHCALLWFQQKGNRTCEICGKPAMNIAGIEDTGFRGYHTEDIANITAAEMAIQSESHETDHRCSTSLSRLLLVLLVLAFVLPWAIYPNKKL